MSIRRVLPAVMILVLGLLAVGHVQGQNAAKVAELKKRIAAKLKALKKQVDKKAEKKAADESKPEAGDTAPAPHIPTLKVYEWGVATMSWDGSDEAPADVPDFYYDSGKVPVEAAPLHSPQAGSPPAHDDTPTPDTPKRVKIRKPVLYFDCDRDLAFDLDVHFNSGKLTWMYPKPNRLTDASTVQWDSIRLYPDSIERDKFAPPALHEADPDHWSGYSRDGSTSSLVVNGEHERFLFYEGDRFGLPDADIFRDASGAVIVHNYSGQELKDLRVCLSVDGQPKYWHAPVVPAASGDKPGSLTLTDAALVEADKYLPEGGLKAETQAAGLTEKQAGVFERCWREDFAKADSMSWRRTQKALDELVELRLTVPLGSTTEVHRVGYVLVNKLDLARQAELDNLAVKAAGGDKGAADKLKQAGMAGAGALRRGMADTKLSLKQRLELATILAGIAATR